MARTIKSKAVTVATPVVKPVQKSRHSANNGWKATRNPGDTAELIEVDHLHSYWRVPDDKPDNWLPEAHAKSHKIEGSIVKLTPPADATQAMVDALERSFYDKGAVTVRVMPAEADTRLQVGQEPAETGIDAPNRSLRQVALDRASRVTNARDPKALLVLVNTAMDQGERV